MHKLLLEIPTRIETERLVLRSYERGDGKWYHVMSQRNQPHLARYEAENAVMAIKSAEDAEIAVRDFAADWVSRRAFFLGAFERSTGVFVAQVYVGPVDWGVPEFQIGYFADKDHEGNGYVTEAVRGTLALVFDHLGAHRASVECGETNVRSIRVVERCGMVREGHLREDTLNADGTRTGTLHFGLLKHEFEALRKAGVAQE